MPALRSPAPRPQTAPSTIAAANGSSRSVPAQCSRQPSTWTVSVWPTNEQPLAAAAPLRSPQTFGPAGQELARVPTLSSRAAHPLERERRRSRLIAGDALAADRASQQSPAPASRSSAPGGRTKSGASAFMTRPGSRSSPIAGGSETRPSGASTPNNVLCMLADGRSRRADDRRRGCRARWPRRRRGTESTAARSALHPRRRSPAAARSMPPRITISGSAIAAIASDAEGEEPRRLVEHRDAPPASPSRAGRRCSRTVDPLARAARRSGRTMPAEPTAARARRAAVALGIERVAADRQEADLAGRAMRRRATSWPSMISRHADAGAERDIGEVVEPLGPAEPALADARRH